jgi:predicted nucleic acid-binding protein
LSEVLIDSSAWIDFFRGESEAVRRVDPLLAEDRGATTGIITAEVASGARTRAVFDELVTRLAALSSLPEPQGLWPRVAELRSTLARQGFQAHLIDLAIALVAADSHHALLTRDHDFEAIARAVALDLELF